jgi:hypothetical protein
MRFQAVYLGLYAAQNVAAAVLGFGVNSKEKGLASPLLERQSLPPLSGIYPSLSIALCESRY